MGCDIHWILEAQDPAGDWHAFHSKDFAYHLWESAGAPTGTIFETPDRLFGQRAYIWFGALSGVRCDPIPGTQPFLAPGLPDTASAHARQALDPQTFELHSHGHARLDLLFCRIDQAKQHADSEDREVLDHYSALLHTFLEPGFLDSLVGDGAWPGILHGRAFCPDTSRRFPDLHARGHGRLSRIDTWAACLPLSAARTRLLVAYDN